MSFTNAMTRAATASFAAIKAVAGVPIAYQPSGGSGTVVRVIGVRGKPTSPVNDSDGGMIRVESLADDWTVAAADLANQAGTVTPTEGDSLTDGSSTWQVTSPPYTWDRTGTRLRIHTKQVS